MLEEAAKEAAAAAARVAPLIKEYPGHLVPRYRIRPAKRPDGFGHGDEKASWPTGSFVEAPYCDGWWSGYVISNKGDRLHKKTTTTTMTATSVGGVLGSNPGGGDYVEGRVEGDVQVAFLKPPVGEGGYGYFRNGHLRRALEWDKREWFDHQTDQRFPPS